MTLLVRANLALRFLLELSVIAIAAWWGWATGDGATRPLLAVGPPLAVIVVWACFVSPKRRYDLPAAARLAVEFIVWAAGGLALADLGHGTAGAAFAVVAVRMPIVASCLQRTRLSRAPIPPNGVP